MQFQPSTGHTRQGAGTPASHTALPKARHHLSQHAVLSRIPTVLGRTLGCLQPRLRGLGVLRPFTQSPRTEVL